MSERLLVRASPGLVFPHAAPVPGFVGYERVRDGVTSPDDHVIPNGPRYRLRAEPEQVPSNSYYRRAIARGDITEAASEPEAAPEPEAPAAPEAEVPEVPEATPAETPEPAPLPELAQQEAAPAEPPAPELEQQPAPEQPAQQEATQAPSALEPEAQAPVDPATLPEPTPEQLAEAPLTEGQR